MNGPLFTQDFLLDGIKTTPLWTALPESVLDEFIADLQRVYASCQGDSALNAADFVSHRKNCGSPAAPGDHRAAQLRSHKVFR